MNKKKPIKKDIKKDVIKKETVACAHDDNQAATYICSKCNQVVNNL